MRVAFALAILLTIATPSFAANLLANADFETAGGTMGGTPVVPGWTAWSNGAGNKTYGVKGADAYNPSSAPHGGAQSFVVYCRSNFSGGIYQQVTVTPGKQYVLDGWWKGYSDDSITVWSEVGMLNGAWDYNTVNGGTSSTIWKRTDQYWPNPNSDPAGYLRLSTETFLAGGLGTNIITATSSTITVWTKVGGGISGNKARVRMDDFTLEEYIVPEPGSILAMLTGLAGLAGVVRRRR